MVGKAAGNIWTYIGIKLNHQALGSIMPDRFPALSGELHELRGQQSTSDPGHRFFGVFGAKGDPPCKSSPRPPQGVSILDVEPSHPCFSIHATACPQNTVIGEENRLGITFEQRI